MCRAGPGTARTYADQRRIAASAVNRRSRRKSQLRRRFFRTGLSVAENNYGKEGIYG